MKFVHEFRTIANLIWVTIDVIEQTVRYLENDGATAELLGVLAKDKEMLKALYDSALEISDRDIDKQTSETLRITSLTTLSGILDEYSKTVDTTLHNMDLEHHDDILYFLGITTKQSQTIKNEIGLASV